MLLAAGILTSYDDLFSESFIYPVGTPPSSKSIPAPPAEAASPPLFKVINLSVTCKLVVCIVLVFPMILTVLPLPPILITLPVRFTVSPLIPITPSVLS